MRVGGAAAEGDGGEQRGVEPAAVLVAAFEVEVGGPVQVGVDVEDGEPACAGVEPDVEDVRLFAERGAAAVSAGRSGGKQSRRRRVVCQASAPSWSKRSTMLLLSAVIDERLVALLAEEDGDGHAPDALAADAPVGAGGDHVGDALFAPGGIPDDLVDLVDGELAEGGFGAVGALSSGFPCEMNHCSVARKMTGLWQRQQCG